MHLQEKEVIEYSRHMKSFTNINHFSDQDQENGVLDHQFCVIIYLMLMIHFLNPY